MKYCKIQKKIVSVFLASIFALIGIAAVCSMSVCTGAAQTVYYSDADYNGGGLQIEDSEYIYHDGYTVHSEYQILQAPSYGNGDPTKTNLCAATAGTNIVGFYDKTYTNLIPNFEPGMWVNGVYRYFPNVGFAAITQVFNTLYDEMQVNVDGIGASEEDFKSGLNTYVEDHGYNLSFSSFYSNSTNVNLSTFGNAINEGKIGVLFCRTYNFVYTIQHSEGQTFVSKLNSENPHIMMAYGYITIDYYQNGSIFRTDTYLQVSSGFSSADQGYIKMNDDLQIEEALIVNIS